MKKPLTDKERAILEFVISATRLNGYPPSVRDICAETGIKSTSTVFSYIKRLEEKGYLEKEDGKSRSIRTKADPAERNSIRVPLIGDVAAGLPILASEDLSGEEYIDFTPSGGSASSFGGRLFALRIRGTSMIEAGILDGDIVVVERTPVADDGDIVVALIGDEATVKKTASGCSRKTAPWSLFIRRSFRFSARSLPTSDIIPEQFLLILRFEY